MGAEIFGYVYISLLRITERKQLAKFGNKERPVLRQPKCRAKKRAKKAALPETGISVDGKSKNLRNSRKGEQGAGKKGKYQINLLTLQSSKVKGNVLCSCIEFGGRGRAWRSGGFVEGRDKSCTSVEHGRERKGEEGVSPVTS